MIYSTDSSVLLPYYGSTTLSLNRRFQVHKAHFKQWKQGKITGCSSFMLLEQGFDKVAIILVEDYPCNSKQELEIREAHYIKNIPCINMKIPQGIVFESRQDYTKQYYQANRDKILEQDKQYRQANRDKILEQKKQYYQSNRDKLLEPIVCECGATVSRNNLARHRRTIKHKRLLDDQPKPKPKIKPTIKPKPKPNPPPKSKPESVPRASKLVGN